eukprot:TRINITY_DN17058_c0_g1_i1.p1 TRINITY_DN17058_c0_g1~~TRINITY_DN17058_c0_g1_i1.p1  ORF type:complete len:360 (-),score=57.72 TRINITY_DN17058_c0_g1_i1:555-1634(-)
MASTLVSSRAFCPRFTSRVPPSSLLSQLQVSVNRRYSVSRRCKSPRHTAQQHPARALSSGAESSGSLVSVASKESNWLSKLSEATAQADSEAVRAVLDGIKEEGTGGKLWKCYPNITRRTTFIRELSSVGIKNAEELAIPSVRNDVAFLAYVVGGTSILAVAAGQLPGDWGFFVPYLLGSVSLVVLAIGSTAPGLFEAALALVSKGFPDAQERVLRHEAAHFLIAYLVGLPCVGYSLDLGKEHTNLMDEKLVKRIYTSSLEGSELDRLAVVSMAGLAAEGLTYDKVMGQSADLFSLQRLMNRSKTKLSNEQQQNLTRWAVFFAATLLKTQQAAFEALMKAMEKKASVAECIQAIEEAAV